MNRTIAKLRSYIEDSERNPHVFTAGRSVDYEIPDYISDGFALLTEDADMCAIGDGGDEQRGEGPTGEDLGVN